MSSRARIAGGIAGGARGSEGDQLRNPALFVFAARHQQLPPSKLTSESMTEIAPKRFFFLIATRSPTFGCGSHLLLAPYGSFINGTSSRKDTIRRAGKTYGAHAPRPTSLRRVHAEKPDLVVPKREAFLYARLRI